MDTTSHTLDQYKQKYESLLSVTEQQQIHLQNLHVQDNKLFIRGVAPSVDAKNRFWDELKRINPRADDITADITVDTALAPSASSGRTYKVKSGDTLSRISKEFYGDPNQYMKIFEANRDKLSNPDRIQVGQELVVP